jgi:hypothetical protein
MAPDLSMIRGQFPVPGKSPECFAVSIASDAALGVYRVMAEL